MFRYVVYFFFFFFSSRRRHTRCSRDWSSDVCSSDLREVREQTAGWLLLSFPGWTPSPVCRWNPELPLRSLLRSEEHTSELQSRLHLVCRLLLEKKKEGRSICRLPIGTRALSRTRPHK